MRHDFERFEFRMTLAQARSASHPGQCDAEVLALSRVPTIRRQLEKLNPALVAAELQGYGAWDEQDLADREQNLQRVVWLAAGDIVEEHHDY